MDVRCDDTIFEAVQAQVHNFIHREPDIHEFKASAE